jgi:nucleoside-diphosphate-sugar epimerase
LALVPHHAAAVLRQIRRSDEKVSSKFSIGARRYLQDFTVEEICDCSKARSHLGFAPRPAGEAITRAFRWLATHGAAAAGADMLKTKLGAT